MMTATMTAPRAVDRRRVRALVGEERRRFAETHPASRRLFEESGSLQGGVPMGWMGEWAGGFPIAAAEARGARVVDVDGHEYVDFCLGDTGAMAGHSPEPTVAAVVDRIARLGGLTTMLPTADAAWVGEELARRFGLPQWQFTLSATDANRFALRICRHLTGRPKVLVFAWNYHGTVDESFVVLRDGRPISRPGNLGPQVDPTLTTKVCEFNDLPAVEAALSDRDVACVLTEPALTNIGIVLPEPGFLQGLRAATRATDTLLIIDETHTLSAGLGGCTAAWGLEPDMVTMGKALAGGVPIGAYGLSAAVAAATSDLSGVRWRSEEHGLDDLTDANGIGGTLAGNQLSLAAARATLAEVLTADAFAGMIARCDRFVAGVEAAIARHRAPFCVIQVGARCEVRFAPVPPRSGGESAAAHDGDLDEFFHLWMLNRGVLTTPFHNMALMCPATVDADVDLHTERFDAACAALFA